jgi:hypothetical protein
MSFAIAFSPLDMYVAEDVLQRLSQLGLSDMRSLTLSSPVIRQGDHGSTVWGMRVHLPPTAILLPGLGRHLRSYRRFARRRASRDPAAV